MKILMLTPDFPPLAYGGIGTYVHRLAREYVQMGHNVTVVVARADCFVTSIFEERIEDNIKIIEFLRQYDEEIKIPNEAIVRFSENNNVILSKVMNLFATNNYDVVHVNDWYFAIVMDRIKKYYSCIIISTIHATSSHRKLLLEYMRSYTVHNSDKVIAVSNYIKEDILQRYHVDEEKVGVVYSGVDSSKNLGEKHNYITYIGRISKTKGCECLINAYKRLVDNGNLPRNMILKIIGTGALENKIKEMVKEFGLEKNIVFYGKLEHEKAMEILSHSILNVIPSVEEPYGLVALESMAEGTCAIASDVGGLKEIIKDGENGVLIPVNDYIKLASTILHILEDTKLRERFEENGIKFAKKIPWSKTAQDTMYIYEKCLEKKN